MTKNKYVVFTVICLLATSCFYSNEKVDEELTAYSYDTFKYALAIKYHTTGRGNVHTLSFSKYEFDDADWIYTNKLFGQVSSDSLVFTHYQDGFEYPMKSSRLNGSVTFDTLTVTIDLTMPEYDDSSKIKRWVPYEFNGKYKLKASASRPPIIDPKP